MSKLSPIITLAVTAALLAGCSAATQEPEAEPAVTAESASPPATPTATAEEATPQPKETQPEDAPSPSPEPSQDPAGPVVETPDEPAPDLAPLPAGPNDPFVPPPHGEPNPHAPVTPGVPGVPHVNPEYFTWVVVTPVPGSAKTAPTATVQQGQTLAVVGSGYAPGQHVYVMLGWPNTDYNYILEPATAVADRNGYFIYPVEIGTNVPPRDYVVMTAPRDVDAEVRETLKRFHNVIITAG